MTGPLIDFGDQPDDPEQTSLFDEPDREHRSTPTPPRVTCRVLVEDVTTTGDRL